MWIDGIGPICHGKVSLFGVNGPLIQCRGARTGGAMRADRPSVLEPTGKPDGPVMGVVGDPDRILQPTPSADITMFHERLPLS